MRVYAYNHALVTVEQALRNADTLDRARGLMIGGLSQLGVRTIWYRHPHALMGMLFDTAAPMPAADRLYATILAGNALSSIDHVQHDARVSDVPHSMRPLLPKLLKHTAYRELYETIAGRGAEVETIAIPLARIESSPVQLFLGGMEDDTTYAGLIGDLDRLRETALVYHDKIKGLLVPGAGQITRHEMIAISWAMQGKTNWEIAQIERVSESAITKRISNAMQKIRVTSRSRLVTLASLLGLPSPPLQRDQAA